MEKLRKNKEFNKVYNKGIKHIGKYLILFEYFSNNQKFGVVASKKVGNSVYRSRAKRLIREAIRLNIQSFKLDRHYVLVMKSIFKDKFSTLKYIDIEKDLKYILHKAKNEAYFNKINRNLPKIYL